MTILPSRAATCARFGVLAALALGGCGVNRTVPNVDMSSDGQTRHPIVLAEASYTTDVFPTGGTHRLDRGVVAQIHDFANRYKEVGQGEVTMLLPQGGPSGVQATYLAPALRSTLEREIARPVAVASYPVADPSLAAPVRLTFRGIKAKVAHACGDFPSDLASGSSLRGWDNEPYWNFGCSQQNLIAAQVADPRDLVTPRGETPTDTAFRMRAINNVRNGTDPGTTWKTSNSSIGQVGSGGQ